MKNFRWIGLVLLSSVGLLAQAPVPVARPQRPIPAVEHVVVISVDGLRPDRALLADMPTLRGLLRDGAYTFWAKTTPSSVTLPSHVSMVTGVSPRKHGIEWNVDLPLLQQVYPKFPTVMEFATRVGYDTAMIAGKSKFQLLNKPGTISHVAISSKDKGANDEVVAAAEKIISSFRPALAFIHLPDVDSAGHAKGWGSAEQLAAIEKTDRDLARILAALEQAGLRGSTVVLLTSDHGGAGLTHGPDDPRSRHIPWIVSGTGVRKNFDLTQIDSLEVRTEDTAATVCWLLGLALPANFDGHPVRAAFSSGG